MEVSGKVCFLVIWVNRPFKLREIQQWEMSEVKPAQLHTHSLHKHVSHPIRKAHTHTDAPVTLIHRLWAHMWSDGAVDTVDRCRGKDGFQSACQARVGSTSASGGLTRALARSQGCVHSRHPYTRSQWPMQLRWVILPPALCFIWHICNAASCLH